MKIERVVIGMDFSRAAIDTAAWAISSFAPGAQVILAHAIEPSRRRAIRPGPYGTTPAAAAHDATVYGLHEIARSLGVASARVDVRTGRAHAVVRDIAVETQADLVAVGRHGDPRRSSRILGTTADRIIRTTRIPVLIGGTTSDQSTGRIVVGVAEAGPRASVLAWSQYASQVLDAEVTLLHAIGADAHEHILAGKTTGDGWGTADFSRETHWLEREGAYARIDPDRLACRIVSDEASEAILDEINRRPAQLVILGRRDSVRRMPALLGRTLRHVLHEAECAVLVVTPTEDEIVDEPE